MKTLGLNIIVGAGEAFELSRCLRSVVLQDLFEEIVICLTTKDPDVEKVAKHYTNKTPYFKWCNNFSAARNCALKNSTTDYIMWLDADDVVEESTRDRLYKMKEYLQNETHTAYLIPYYLEFDKQNNYTQGISRDRIFKRQRNLKWIYKVHEQLTLNSEKHSVAAFNGIAIEHRPIKLHGSGLARNLKILKEEYLKDKTNGHYAFYYARDLELNNQIKAAIPIYEKILKCNAGSPDNLFLCAFNLAMYYTYKKNSELRTDTLLLAENYCRIAISYSESYAEPYVLLGDIYHFKGNLQEAILFFKTAMSKRLNASGLQRSVFYNQLPAERLSRIFASLDEFTNIEQALYYNKLALQYDINNKDLLKFRKVLIKAL